MAPTLATAWRKIRGHDKSGVRVDRSQSEIIMGVRLHGLSTTAVANPRSRASSVELSSSQGTADDHDERVSALDDELPVSRGRGESYEPPSQMELKVFVGSWNMAAKDPFAVVRNTSKGATSVYMGDKAAAEKVRELLPAGYDLYVLGTQEKVSKHLHAAVLARLHAAPEHNGRKFVTLREAKRRATRSGSDTRSTGDSEASGSINSSYLDRFRSSSFAVEASASASASGFTPRGAGGATGSTGTNQADEEDHVERESIKEVRGRGDGAFLHAKSTSIAIYCASDLAQVVEIEQSVTHKFSWSSGSKGGVAVRLSVGTRPGAPRHQRRTVTFANCHLEANKPALRRKQLAVLSTKLGQSMAKNGDDINGDLAASSDHVVWMGDFNYRIHTLDGETVLKLLVSGKHLDVHDRYDSMQDDLKLLPSMAPFKEPRKWPSFYPTYKKIPGRPTDFDPLTDPWWPQRIYRVMYKEPFYKGGKVTARVPGWCDRILFCSRDEGGSDSQFHVEQVEKRDNYRAVNHGLCESDHSPVYATFEWTIWSPAGEEASSTW